ncbi:major facilitator superfamily domain-containing protein [Ephemerocybe angulata]|uniref:Major facilitator superfamily domain-containing protein n=1 Tax=Ephemerocybe angulata TaxID=980116 RepID=A0A8H6MAM0_9AGAR|nr:major facilitator superfamily domain-containing protein [Tulosesus angulatus]
MAWTWFGPISNKTAAEFNITLDQVNWLGNVMAVLYLPTALLIPGIVSRWGIRRCTEIGGVALILASWLRYAGTAKSLSPAGAYALLFIGQVFAAIAQPMYQCLGTKYSETWFDTKGRTTATMIVAIANPVGGAVGQLVSPIVDSTRTSILILGIATTVIVPCVFLIGNKPPTPPTYAASKPPGSLWALLLAMAGRAPTRESFMSVRERIDFGVIIVVFGFLVAAIASFSILTNQIFEPVGYNEETSGLLGACLLLAGIVAAIITAPLFDRVFTYHLALSVKICAPITGIVWLSLIWAVKPNNTAGLFVVMAIIGIGSLTMLPVALELACETTRNADASSAILWSAGNTLSIMFVLAQQELRAGPDGRPPLNMKKALILNGVFCMVGGFAAVLLKGEQTRKKQDEEKQEQSEAIATANTENNAESAPQTA